jgi:hypothetical protein
MVVRSETLLYFFILVTEGWKTMNDGTTSGRTVDVMGTTSGSLGSLATKEVLC